MGFLLALTTAFMWGVLPVFLKVLLVDMDAFTITAIRFIFAGVFVAVLLFSNKALPRIRQHHKWVWIILGLSTLMLLINYVSNVIALNYISPSTVQLILQLAPFILLIGGVVLYKESFSRLQLIGALMLFSGLGLFFNQRIPVILTSTTESIEGVVLVVISATAWAMYALSQKKLLASFTSSQLTLLIYIIGTIFLLPFTQFSETLALTGWQYFALIFCCLNTLIGYGAFTHAMQIWDASKVSAILATAPVFTYLSNEIAIMIAPDIFFDPQLDVWAYIGALFIILGAMLASIGKAKPKVS